MHGSVGHVMMIESGDMLEFDELGARKAGKVTVGRICIDSNSMGDVVEDLVIRDRRHLSEDGIVLPIIAINKLTWTRRDYTRDRDARLRRRRRRRWIY